MPENRDELLQAIEEHRALAERFRDDAPSVWGLQLRLFGEKVCDFVGAQCGLDAEEYGDRDEFLKALHSNDAIGDEQYRQLDKIRWVGNQLVHGKQKTVTQVSMSQAWTAFDALSASQFWLRGVQRPSDDIDIDQLFGALQSFFNNSGGMAKKAGKLAAQGAGAAVAGAVLYGIIKHTTSPEYKAQVEQERQRNAKMIKFILICLAVLFSFVLLIEILGKR